MRYLSVMLKEMEQMRTTKAGCRAYGIDQGYHNYLFRNGRFGSKKQIKVWPQGEGPVNTVGYVCQREDGRHSLTDRLKLNKDGFVLNDDGSKSAAIHQWDRCFEQLTPFVGSKHVMWPNE